MTGEEAYWAGIGPEDEFDDYEETCGECGGEGYVLNDCFEDTCCCADPEAEHGYSPCSTCGIFIAGERGTPEGEKKG